MSYIKNNIEIIQDNIGKACTKSGTNPNTINIVGVTKTIDIPQIEEAIEYGISFIGENKVQEIRDKYDKINKSVKWHMIGHLQTNKVKYIIDKVSLIHSVDSIRLAEEINKRCAKNNKTMDILVQINIAKDDSKFGINPCNIKDFIDKLSNYNNISIKGFMTIIPYVDDSEDARVYFKAMKEIFDSYKTSIIKNIDMKYLSMGMTNDYIVAIEEGANMVRVGTGIFGQRNYE